MFAEQWPDIAAALPAKWPDAAVGMDLRYWENEQRMGRRGRPGRPALIKRWGWTDHRVRTFIKSGCWEDETTSEPPANRQPTASRPPTQTSANLYNDEETASRPPADRQPTASESPHACRLTTEQPTTNKEQVASVEHAPPVGWAGVKREAATRCYEHYRTHHPRKPAAVTAPELTQITRALELIAKTRKGDRSRYEPEDWDHAEAKICEMFDCYHTAPTCSYNQGDNPAGKKHLGIELLTRIKLLPGRLGTALEWVDAGRPINTSQGSQRLTAEAEKAWVAVLKAIPKSHRSPTKVSEDPARNAAAITAMRAVGVQNIRRANHFDQRAMKPAFCEAYAIARRER